MCMFRISLIFNHHDANELINCNPFSSLFFFTLSAESEKDVISSFCLELTSFFLSADRVPMNTCIYVAGLVEIHSQL